MSSPPVPSSILLLSHSKRGNDSKKIKRARNERLQYYMARRQRFLESRLPGLLSLGLGYESPINAGNLF